MGAGDRFNGIIHDGFHSVILTGVLQIKNEEKQLEGGTIMGVDDFTFGFVQGVPEPASSVFLKFFVLAWLNRSRVSLGKNETGVFF